MPVKKLNLFPREIGNIFFLTVKPIFSTHEKNEKYASEKKVAVKKIKIS